MNVDSEESHGSTSAQRLANLRLVCAAVALRHLNVALGLTALWFVPAVVLCIGLLTFVSWIRMPGFVGATIFLLFVVATCAPIAIMSWRIVRNDFGPLHATMYLAFFLVTLPTIIGPVFCVFFINAMGRDLMRRAGVRVGWWGPTPEETRKIVHGFCEGCGYDLIDLPSGNCPECGRAFAAVAGAPRL